MNDTALNYVWIHPDRLKSRQIPAHYFDVAVDTCRRHPNVDKFLWLDSAQQVSVADEKIKQAGLIVRDMRDIEAYIQDPLFQRGHDAHNRESIIWHQVDLARMLVLQHCLEKAGYRNAFYSDLDIDFDLNGKKLQTTMSQFGMVFGQQMVASNYAILENQFIGMTAQSRGFIKDILLPEVQKTISESEQPDGWGALCRALHQKFPEFEVLDELLPLTVEVGEVKKSSQPKINWWKKKLGHLNAK